MPLLDLLKNRHKPAQKESTTPKQPTPRPAPPPEFTFMRTTTNTQEIIYPPTFPEDNTNQANAKRPSILHSRKSSRASTASVEEVPAEIRQAGTLEKLHFGRRSRRSSVGSAGESRREGESVKPNGEERVESSARGSRETSPSSEAEVRGVPRKRSVQFFDEREGEGVGRKNGGSVSKAGPSRWSG